MNILPILTIFLIFVYYQFTNHNKFNIITLLLLVYIAMAFASILLELFGLKDNPLPFSFEPMVYLSICFLIVFTGFIGLRDTHLQKIRIENIRLYRVLEYVLIIGGFLAIIYFLPYAFIGFSGDVKFNRIGVAALSEGFAQYGIINSLFSILANLFILALLCAFINLVPINGKRNIIKVYLLLLSSFSFVIYILAYVGRDGVVYWIMTFIFCFYLFKNIISKDDKIKILRIFVFSVPVILIPFIIISYARFSDSDMGVMLSIIDYAGQQIRNFNDVYRVDVPLQYGQNAFPAVFDSLGLLNIDVQEKEDTQYFYLLEGTVPWVFKTYIGSLLADFGRFGTVIFLLFMHMMTRLSLFKVKRKMVFDFSNLLIFLLLYQMVYWGVFYNRFYSMNYYVILIVLISLSFKILRSRSSIITIERSTLIMHTETASFIKKVLALLVNRNNNYAQRLK